MTGRRSWIDWVLLPVAGAAVLVFGLEYLGSPLAGAVVRTYVAAVPKTLFFVIGLWFAWRSAALFDRGNPARPAWVLLAGGLSGFTLGQTILDYYQLRYGRAPFPSVADAFFLVGYPLFLAALVRFALAYREVGYPLGSVWQHAATVLLLLAASITVGYQVLGPVVRTPAPRLELALNVAYPVLDLLLFLPTAILLRIALGFRGGEVWRMWAALLGGIVLMGAGDILFAYQSSLGQSHLNALVHATYIVSYALLARGTAYQYELLKA